MSTADSATWTGLWRQVGTGANSRVIYEELLSHYSELQRHYHTLAHISDMLTEFEQMQAEAKDPLALELAIWFHDVIYDTHASDNEERSADLARKRIEESGASAGLAEKVARFTLATKTHNPGSDSDAQLLVDLDLAILGQFAERFDQYEAQIRQEYDWAPEEVFNTRRAEILERFLARPRIYSTRHCFSRYERKARKNLQRSISKLRGP